MAKVVQEKFQVTMPAKKPVERDWVAARTARVQKGNPGREGRRGGDEASKAMNNALMMNSLPPGTDIEDQETSDQRVFPMTMGGESDVSADYNAGAVERGFTKRGLLQTDDEYSKQHDDAFYDDVGGFVERNNMLDRL